MDLSKSSPKLSTPNTSPSSEQSFVLSSANLLSSDGGDLHGGNEVNVVDQHGVFQSDAQQSNSNQQTTPSSSTNSKIVHVIGHGQLMGPNLTRYLFDGDRGQIDNTNGQFGPNSGHVTFHTTTMQNSLPQQNTLPPTPKPAQQQQNHFNAQNSRTHLYDNDDIYGCRRRQVSPLNQIG